MADGKTYRLNVKLSGRREERLKAEAKNRDMTITQIIERMIDTLPAPTK